MYEITHTYLTMDDDGTVVVETERDIAQTCDDIQGIVARMVEQPGRRSGTTLTLTVMLSEGQTAAI